MKRNFLLYLLLFMLGVSVCAGAASDPEASYQEAVKAIAAKDYSTALGHLEAALAAQPDSIRYASEYRMAAVQAKQHDRSLKYFEKLAGDNPKSANIQLNYGFAYVDKIPIAGSITQVILANNALTQFTKAVELQPTWIGYYTRGNSYLYWPKIFNRTALGVADLEAAVKVQKNETKRPYHARAWVALGDAYWKSDDLEKAKATWKEGLQQFPDHTLLKMRVALAGDELKAAITDSYDFTKPVDTNLRDLWTSQ